MKKKAYQSAIVPVLLINFIGALGFSLILPFLVFVVKDFGGNEVVYGIMGAVYPAFQLIGAPILGRWSDKIGRRKVLLISQGGTLLAWVVFLGAFYLPIEKLFDVESSVLGTFVFTLPLLILFLARALDGITGGNISVANAYLADISTNENRKRNFGWMGAAASLGFIGGPMISGLLSDTSYGEKLPVIAAILVSLIALFIIYFLLPECPPELEADTSQDKETRKTLGLEVKDCKTEEKESTVMSFAKLWNYRNVSTFFVIYFLIFLGFNFFYSSFPVHAAESLNWDSTELGVFFSILSLLMAFVQGFLISFFGKYFSEKTLMIIGMILLSASFIIISLSLPIWTYIATAFFALGNGISWTSFLSLLSSSTEKKYQGLVQGTAQSFGSLSSILGLVLGGILYANFESKVFWLAAVIMVLVAIWSWIKITSYSDISASVSDT